MTVHHERPSIHQQYNSLPEQTGNRLDVFLAQASEHSRTAVAEWISDGRVRINGAVVTRASHKLMDDSLVEVEIPVAMPVSVEPQDIPLNVVFEDEWLIVINKPAGLVVHPAAGHVDQTLVNALLFHCKDLSGIGGDIRPGIVHRIDRDTSGLLVATKNDSAHQCLSDQFAEHSIERAYWAISVRGNGPGLAPVGTFATGHERHASNRKKFTGSGGGKKAVTHYRVIESFSEGAKLVELTLETGRTHQIRMHLSEFGCPILGDELYAGRAIGNSRLISRVALHAKVLGFTHPNGQRLRFEVQPPADFSFALEKLRKGGSWRS